MTKTVLVTGACGKLGSHITTTLRQAGYWVVGIDNLKRSCKAPDGPLLYVADFSDYRMLDTIFNTHDIGAVIHTAAFISPAESVAHPGAYFENNVTKTLKLLQYLEKTDANRFIFSSSAAVYGSEYRIHQEFDTLRPASPYAHTKSIIERELGHYKLRSISFRYFNPIVPKHTTGTVLGEMLAKAGTGVPVVVNGMDWATPDGSPVRDFIDVEDLARAHVHALDVIDALPLGNHPVNLGSGRPVSVLRLARKVSLVTDSLVVTETGPRREGDVAGGYADISMAIRLMNWTPRIPIEQSIQRAWMP
jgi:UDP-glucose 4-epimerase